MGRARGFTPPTLPFGDNQKVVTACPPQAPLSGKGLEVALAFRKNQMIVIADPPLPLLFWNNRGVVAARPLLATLGRTRGLSHIGIPWRFHLVNLASYTSIGAFFAILAMLIPLPVVSVVFGSFNFFWSFFIILELFGPFWAILVIWAIFVHFHPFSFIFIHFHPFSYISSHFWPV